MVKLIFFASRFAPFVGGLETYLTELTSRLVKRGNSVTVVCLNTEEMAACSMMKGVKVIRLPYKYAIKGKHGVYPILNKRDDDYKRLMKTVDCLKYDYLITNTRFNYMSWIGMRYAKKHKINHIHIEHGNSYLIHPNPIITLGAFCYDQTIGRMIMHNAFRVIGISKKCCYFVKKLGVPDDKVGLIYNAVDLNKFQKVKTDLRKRLGIKQNARVITYVGRLNYAKGIHHLINVTRNCTYKVLIVGKGPYLEQLYKISHENVIFLGEKSQKEIVEILSITNLFVNPSFREGLPTSVLEANAMGLPIVATDVGGTSEIIDRILIKPNDPKALDEAIGKAFYRKEKFDWEEKAGIWDELLNGWWIEE